MAKGKHATALFEVMNKAKLPGKNGAPSGGIPTPKWWFKSKSKAEVRTLSPGETDQHPVDEPTPREAERVTPLTSSIDVPDSIPTAPSPRVQPMTVSVDKERQLISLRLSYTSALIGGFGLFILVALAILIGKSLSKGPAPAIANQDTKSLKSGPANPGVMNVRRQGEGSLGPAETEIPRGNSTGTRTPQRNTAEPPATFFTDDPRRTLGLNYAIIQSYPDKETADKAAEFLTKNGVPCTVERDLPGWPLPWREGCVVVGIRGFSKVRDNGELEKYKKQIMELSAKFAQGRSRFVAFAPVMYSWKKAN